MSNLIYLISFGDRAYHDMTRLCVKSLRRRGNFHGDIIVFSDGTFEVDEENVTVINFPKMNDPFKIKTLKSNAYKWIDLSKYKQIAYMDSDMLAIRDVKSLFCANGKSIVCASEYPFNSMLSESSGSSLFKHSERARVMNRWGLNTGFLAMNSNSFKRNMSLWYKTIIEKKHSLHEWIDQPCFNWLAFQKRFQIKELPNASIEIPALYAFCSCVDEFKISKNTKILHFIGAKLPCLEAMHDISKQMERGDSPKAIETFIRSTLKRYSHLFHPSLDKANHV